MVREADGKERSSRFTYEARSSRQRVLIMSAEDYTGPTNRTRPRPGPYYLDDYRGARGQRHRRRRLRRRRQRHDRAPHPLGVLSHYDAVMWYTGDDYVTRDRASPAAPARRAWRSRSSSRCATSSTRAASCSTPAKHAGQQYAEGYEFRNFGFPQPDEAEQGRWCDAATRRPRRVHPARQRLPPVLPRGVHLRGGRQRRTRRRRRSPYSGEGDPFGPRPGVRSTAGDPGNQAHTATSR